MSCFIFYHIAMMGRWEAIVEEQVARLARRGPRDATMFAYAAGDESLFGRCCQLTPGFVSKKYIGPLGKWEFPTLQALHDFAVQYKEPEPGHLLYLHTKGVSHFAQMYDVPSTDWRRYMESCLIDNHQECLGLLKQYDACGADLMDWHYVKVPWNPSGTHFSGNMWWTKTGYVKDLYPPMSLNQERMHAELWVCSRKVTSSDPKRRFASPAVTGFNGRGYDHLFPEWRYEDARRNPLYLEKD